MDLTTIFSVLTPILAGVIGWIVKGQSDRLMALEKNFSAHQLHVAESYVRKQELHRELEEIKGMMRKIFEILEKRNDCTHQ